MRVEGDIEWLFKLYRELNERLTRLEDMLKGDVSDEEVKALEKLLAARPWYVKLASWVQRHEEAAMWTIGGLVTAGVLVVLIA